MLSVFPGLGQRSIMSQIVFLDPFVLGGHPSAGSLSQDQNEQHLIYTIYRQGRKNFYEKRFPGLCSQQKICLVLRMKHLIHDPSILTRPIDGLHISWHQNNKFCS